MSDTCCFNTTIKTINQITISVIPKYPFCLFQAVLVAPNIIKDKALAKFNTSEVKHISQGKDRYVPKSWPQMNIVRERYDKNRVFDLLISAMMIPN